MIANEATLHKRPFDGTLGCHSAPVAASGCLMLNTDGI